MPSTSSRFVQLVHQIEQLLLGDRAVRLMVEGTDADLLTGLALAAHVDGGGRIVADQNRG